MEAVFYPFPYMKRHVSENKNQRRIATLLPYVVYMCTCVCVQIYSVCVWVGGWVGGW